VTLLCAVAHPSGGVEGPGDPQPDRNGRHVTGRPASLDWSLIAAGGALTGIGFTMAIFIADLAFDDALLSSAKLGILAASVVAAVVGLLALTWLTSRGRTPAAP
jgi:Na+/H+ antiporter NhaA